MTSEQDKVMSDYDESVAQGRAEWEAMTEAEREAIASELLEDKAMIQERYRIMLHAIIRDGVDDPEYDEHMILDFLVEIMYSDLSKDNKHLMTRELLSAWNEAANE